MARSVVPTLSIAVLIVIAGCSGFTGSQIPTDTATPTAVDKNVSSFQELENATLWIGGTVERIEEGIIYIDDQQYTNVVIPVLVRDRSAAFHCQPKNHSGISCKPIELSDVQPGEDVCASILAKNGTLNVIKVFFNATCAGAQRPSK